VNRSLTAVFAALEAVLVMGVGIGITLVPLTIMWAAQYGFAVDWAVFWRASVDTWLLGHGVDMRVTLDSILAADLGIAPADASFPVTIAPLGFAVLTLLLAVRAGRRVGETRFRGMGGVVSLATFGILSGVLTLTTLYPLARPSIGQGIVLPSLVFALGLGIGLLQTRRPVDDDNGSSIRDWIADWSPSIRLAAATALRAGAAAVAAIVAVSSLLVAVLLAVNYAAVISLYEGLHSGVVGGIAVTVGQLAFLPNLVLFAASWLVGPGFAIGAGSSVSPLATQLGPLPAVPFLGALPSGDLAFGFVGILVPVAAGFLVAAVLRARLVDELDVERPVLWLVGIGFASGVVAGLLLGGLSWAAGGAAGPGRLAEVGADPLAVGLFAALEVGASCVVGLLVARSRDEAAR
jgi:hypothetical protein